MFVQACNAFSENTVLLPDGEGGVVVFDPGFSSAQEWEWFDALLDEHGLVPKPRPNNGTSASDSFILAA